jgi:hypothetical protein
MPRAITLAVATMLTLLTLGVREIQPPMHGEPGATAAPNLAFLTGHWRAEAGGGVMEEQWFPPAHGATTGMLRWLAPDGSLRMLELITIKPGENGEPVLLLRHFDPDMQPWEDEKNGPFTAVTETRESDKIVFRAVANAKDAVSMTYESTGPDGLRVTIGFRESSERQPLVIEFTRVE